MKKVTFRYSCIALAVAFALPVAAKDSANHTPGVEVIQVVGNPNFIDTEIGINDADVKVKQATDLEDLFNQLPNISVGGSYGHAQKIYVRGIEDTNLNINIDGATQSGQLFQHQSRIAIEPELLKRVEIRAGTGTALDGFGAVGGAITFITKDADDLLKPGQDYGALIKTGYFSNNQGLKTIGNFYGKLSENWSGLLVVGKVDSDDIEDGNGQQVANTTSNQEIGLVKMSGEINPYNWLSVSHDIRQDDGIKSLRSQFHNAPWNYAVYQENKRQTTRLNYQFDPESDWLDLTLNTYRTQNEFSFYDQGMSDGGRITTFGVDIRNCQYIDEHELIYGVAYQDDKSKRLKSGTEEEGKIFGLYVQDIWQFSDDINVSLGLRFDDYEFDTASAQAFSANGFSPNVTFKYDVNENFTATMSYAQALRGQRSLQAMNIGEVNYAPNLKEETAKNGEIALEYHTDTLVAKAVVFKNKIDDVMLASGQPMSMLTINNVGELETKGYSLSLIKRWEDLCLNTSYSSAEPSLNGMPLGDDHFSLGTSFGDTFLFGADYQLENYDIKIGWLSRFVKELNRVPTNHPKKESYNIHDLYIEWFSDSIDGLSLDFRINNIFDKYYFNHATYGFDPSSGENLGLPEPGRDIRLTLSLAL